MNQPSLAERFANSLRHDGFAATARKCAVAPFRQIRSWRQRLDRWRLNRSSDPQVIFQMIHRLNVWDSPESVSGPGSTLDYTANLRRHLPAVLRQYGVQTLFDAPCGDFNWMHRVVSAGSIHYIGGDIVPALVQANQSAHGGPRTRFIHFDLTRHRFPAADLWFCRDCLFHLSYRDILSALRNFAESGVPHVLLTNHQSDVPLANTDIRTGGFRPLDLFAPPFNLPREVLCRIPEGTDRALRHEMCLWTREQIKGALPGMEQAMRARETQPATGGIHA
jgi:hypothetical protein